MKFIIRYQILIVLRRCLLSWYLTWVQLRNVWQPSCRRQWPCTSSHAHFYTETPSADHGKWSYMQNLHAQAKSSRHLVCYECKTKYSHVLTVEVTSQLPLRPRLLTYSIYLQRFWFEYLICRATLRRRHSRKLPGRRLFASNRRQQERFLWSTTNICPQTIVFFSNLMKRSYVHCPIIKQCNDYRFSWWLT